MYFGVSPSAPSRPIKCIATESEDEAVKLSLMVHLSYVVSLSHVQSVMTPGPPIFSPMMPYGTGLTPQPVTNTNSLSALEEHQRLQQQQQQSSAQQGGVAGTSGQTPQLYHSQAITTTTALPGNTPLYNATPLTPMTPITPATPASESSGIVPQLQ